MSDVFDGVERENEKSRLEKINIKEATNELQRLRKHVIAYEALKLDFLKLKYIVKEYNNRIEIWKQIM